MLILLGVLTAFDSMAIDMYLPAFFVISDSLRAADGIMEMSLSVFLIGLAVGQAAYGPLIDSYGRRIPLLVGIFIFAAASLLIAISSGAGLFLAGRFLQGLGGAAGLVIPRAIVSDIYEARESTKIFSLLVQIQSISPILSPPLGGVLLAAFGWQAIFAVLVIFGALTLILSAIFIPETQPARLRAPMTVRSVLSGYGALLKNPRYLGMSVAAGLIMGTLFGYISGSSFVFTSHFGLSSSAYSLVFAAVSVGMIIVGQCNFFLCKRMSQERHLALGFILHLVFIGLLYAAVALGHGTFETVTVLLFLAMSSLSLIFGGITAAVMYSVAPTQSGTASALLGVLQYAFGGLSGLVLGTLQDGTLHPFVLVLAACSVLSVMVWRFADRIPKRSV